MCIYIHTLFHHFFYAQMGTNPTQCSLWISGSLCTRAHTPQVSSGWPAFHMLISHSTPQQKPFPFYFPRAFKQAHFWHHLWFNSPGRNLSTYKLPGNISQDWGLEETPLPVTPPDPSGIPLFPKYHLSPCSNPFYISSETAKPPAPSTISSLHSHASRNLGSSPWNHQPLICSHSPLPLNWPLIPFLFWNPIGLHAINPELLGLESELLGLECNSNNTR